MYALGINRINISQDDNNNTIIINYENTILKGSIKKRAFLKDDIEDFNEVSQCDRNGRKTLLYYTILWSTVISSRHNIQIVI